MPEGMETERPDAGLGAEILEHLTPIFAGKPHKDGEQLLEEEKLLTLMYAHRPPEPLHAPLMLGGEAFLPIPRCKSRKWQAAALAGELRPTTEPDLDNCIKNLKDVCKGVFWLDDKQVVEYLPGTGKQS